MKNKVDYLEKNLQLTWEKNPENERCPDCGWVVEEGIQRRVEPSGEVTPEVVEVRCPNGCFHEEL